MRKNSILLGLALVIICLTIGIGIGFVLSNNINKNDVNSNTSNDMNENDVNSSYSDDWVEYLLNQNITESYIRVWGEENKNINLSKDDLKNIFKEMIKSKSEKQYFSGSGDTTPDIVIKYKSKQKNYEIIIKNGTSINSGDDYWDNTLVELLDKSVDKIGEKLESDLYFGYTFKWNSEDYLNSYIKD